MKYPEMSPGGLFPIDNELYALYIANMENTELDSVDVAKAVLAEAKSRNLRLNMTQLQKLLYIVYGTSLVILGRRPFVEHPQAWPFGPVFPRTRRNLSDEVKKWNVDTCPESVPDELRQIVCKVVENFGTWTSGQLVDWSHRIGGPWDVVTHRSGFKWADEIPDDETRDYFDRNVIRRNPA